MNFSSFFITRPIFASVMSMLILIGGSIAMLELPVSEYPEVTPPSVNVRASFPGANPKVIADTVAAPLEEQVNGVENMLYMSSQSTVDGSMSLNVTFAIGTDPDLAQQMVQNRVSQALPRLPDITRQIGVTVVKSAPDLTMVVHLISPNSRYDILYLRNYANLNVKDQLARIPGVGQVRLFGSGDYAMRLWLNPEKLAERNLSASDVVSAIREQNVQVAAGLVGGAPYQDALDIQLPVNAKGRLDSVEEFEQVIISENTETGAVTRLKDVARVELGSADYSLRSLLNNQPAVGIPIFAAPGANAIKISDDVRKAMEDIKQTFPPGLDYRIIYDPTIFVKDSITAVIHTLLEAIALVVIVVIVFLQTWRASIIPLIAVPVSVIGTFAIMLFLGFSINVLTLFGIILAIGIVVDDAIIVVENVERNISNGLSPKDAAFQAMREVTSPIIATTLVLIAVFVPISFVSGLTGQFYKQFALTIAISTAISAFNSLTLSPALCALLLHPHDAKEDMMTRGINRVFGRFFAGFNRFFKGSSEAYHRSLGRVLHHHRGKGLVFYALLLVGAYFIFQLVPTGFVPSQDKQYLISFAQLQDGATLDRTEKVIREMSDIALKQEGVAGAVAFPGLSINGFAASSSAGIVFVTLKPFSERHGKALSGAGIAQTLQQKFAGIPDAFIAIFPPPPVRGLGLTGGFKMQVEDRAGLGFETLNETLQQIQQKAWQEPRLTQVYSSFKINVPQLNAELDRTKVKQLGLKVTDIFNAMQIYLGSLYINDFNVFGRTYRVVAQADAPYRDQATDILNIKVRNDKGEMVPLGAVLKINESYGPESAQHYNAYLSGDINGAPAPGVSSGEAQDIISKIANETMPKGMSFEWTDLTYQQILAGNTTIYIYPLCIFLVFLVLAAQYESLRLPLAVILIVPTALFAAMVGVKLTGGDNNIFTQVSLFVLMALATKNAILIVEFARELEIHRKMKPIEAALEAARLRLRPILMTSFAFIMGVLPMAVSSGAGSEMRNAMGISVFSGMLGVTFFGLILTPIFYVVLRSLGGGELHSAYHDAHPDEHTF